VPYLTWQIYQNNLQAKFNTSLKTYNIQGFMVGNGATDWDIDAEPSYPDTFFNFELIPKSLIDQFHQKGCKVYHANVKPTEGGKDCDDLLD
jgi:hypothetical protein